MEQEQLERPWAEDEKKTFMDKFLQFPKVCSPSWLVQHVPP